ncbi:MAG TPA: hypothetical protein VMA95_18610 [Streptosporangiaceae bacterium]|nr:hypothetical protein [Streptosporangiaceae bacterium]
MASTDPDARRLSYAQSIVEDVADRALKVAEALSALREPEAARAVAQLAKDAARAAAMLGGVLAPEPGDTDKYRFHRELWVRYGDPGDLAAMTEHVTRHGADKHGADVHGRDR